MKNFAYICGVIVGIFAIVLLFFIIELLSKKKNGKKDKSSYDERQEAIRGKAFKFGFIVYSICEVFILFCNIVEINIPLSEIQIHGLILVISVLSFLIYSIWTDSYFQVGEEQKRIIIISLLFGILNIVIFIMNNKNDHVSEVAFLNLLVGIMGIVLCLNILAKNIINKKEEKMIDKE